jgi:steroid delta-isomerase-like uncharacterized protein
VGEQENIAAARANVESFSAKDWERFRACMTPDGVYDEKGTGRRIQGVDNTIEALQGWTRAFPDSRGTITSVVASGDTVVLEITWEGTQTGPLMTTAGTLPASGKRVVVPAVEVLQMKGGKIAENRHYFDLMSLLQEVGAVPAAPAAAS